MTLVGANAARHIRMNPTRGRGKLRIEPSVSTVDAKGMDAHSQVLNSYLHPRRTVDEDTERDAAGRPEVSQSSMRLLPPANAVAASAPTTGSIELDLRCEREQCTTVHTLRWATDGRGRLRGNECTCNTCPRGANTRPWPTRIELQDAGAANRVPPSEDDEQPDSERR
jgi:hypothetical protein